MTIVDPATLAQRHAEVVSVWPRDGYITIHGTLAGFGPPATEGQQAAYSWSVLAVLRGQHDVTNTYVITPAQDTFEIQLPIDTLVPEQEFTQEYWDLYLRVDVENGPVNVRVGRHLDDIADKKRIMKFPGQRVSRESCDVRITPYYTLYNNLSIRARRLERSEAAT